MKKILIYARGQVFEKNLKKIDLQEVAAIVDKNAGKEEVFKDIPVIHPSYIKNFQYDYIAVFSNRLFNEICSELVRYYFVPYGKIVHWKALVNQKNDKINFLEFISTYIKGCKAKSVLDTNISILYKKFLTKESISKDLILLDGIGNGEFPIVSNLYDNLYSNYRDIDHDFYDLVIFWQILANAENINQTLSIAKRCLLIVSYAETFIISIDQIIKELEQYGDIQVFQTYAGYVLLISRKFFMQDSAQIYVVTHKNYNVLHNDLYKPLCVGKYKSKDFLSENEGDNISYLNEKINECSALYWIWKNTNEKIVGLNHYRRYFCDSELLVRDNFLQLESINDILNEFDIILTDLWIIEPYKVIDEIQSSCQNDEAFHKGYYLIRNGIKEKQPDYLSAFDEVMNGHREYICNLFVTKREILNSYCEWLFSFLIEAAEKMDVSSYDASGKRTIGFFAERLWTVWILKQNLKIKEKPYLLL